MNNAPSLSLSFVHASTSVFVEASPAGLALVVRSSSSGSVVHRRVPRESWDRPCMAGREGPDGFVLRGDRRNVFVFDLSWLGAGPVRFGVLRPSGADKAPAPLWLHTVGNSRVRQGPCMRTAKLPMRYELRRSVGTAGSGPATMHALCALAQADGDYIPTGPVVYSPPVQCTVTGTPRLFLAFRIGGNAVAGTADAPALTYPLKYVTMRMHQMFIYSRGGNTALLGWTLYHVSNASALGPLVVNRVNGSTGAYAVFGPSGSGGAASGAAPPSALTLDTYFPIASGMTEGRDVSTNALNPESFMTRLPVRVGRQVDEGAMEVVAGPSELFVLAMHRLDAAGSMPVFVSASWMEEIP